MNSPSLTLPRGPRRLLFDDFELRLDSGELLRGGAALKLQPQPARVLEILAGRSGEVVAREEIRTLVWGDAFVDFDASLNFCIKEIRRVLGDSATLPTFVETVPRRGYRFLRPVRVEPEPEGSPPPPSEAAGPAAVPIAAAAPAPAEPRRRSWLRFAGAAGVAAAVLFLLIFLTGSRLRHGHGSFKPRLAVLPLACRAHGLPDRQVCGGVTEALTAELTRQLSRDLDVIAPFSGIVYGRPKGAEVGGGLDPTLLLSGEAEPSAQGLRVTLTLRTADREDLWKQRFDTNLEDVPLLYGEIARGVARALDLPSPARRPETRPKPSPPAYEAYLRGIYLFRHEQYVPAEAALQESVLLDPTFADAYAYLALARLQTSASTRKASPPPRPRLAGPWRSTPTRSRPTSPSARSSSAMTSIGQERAGSSAGPWPSTPGTLSRTATTPST